VVHPCLASGLSDHGFDRITELVDLGRRGINIGADPNSIEAGPRDGSNQNLVSLGSGCVFKCLSG
jgi:hypothetical protein